MRRVFALDTRAHAVFVAPARASPEVWRLLTGLLLTTATYLLLSQIFFDTVFELVGPGRAASLAQEMNAGSSPVGMYLLLFQFVFLIMATAFACRAVHHRGLSTLIGPPKLARRQFLNVVAAMVMLAAAIWMLPPWDMGAPHARAMPLGRWIVLLPVSLLAVLVQTSAEEILFRGYVQQQLAARFTSPFFWMVLPSGLFALGHYLPEMQGENALMIAAWAGIFGILMADLTARAGTIGPAIAVHFTNNVTALLFVALPDDMSGLALYHAPFGMADAEALSAWLPVDFGMMFVSWLTARLALRR